MAHRSALPNPVTTIERGAHRFLIFDAPNDSNIPIYIAELKKYGVRHLVRACDPTYSTDALAAEGIQVHEMSFTDGGSPPDDVIHRWVQLLRQTTVRGERETIGIHCVAGLGRAPVLVAIALIEDGMNPLAAVDEIRNKRRGSINIKQLKYLQGYKPAAAKTSRCCIL